MREDGGKNKRERKKKISNTCGIKDKKSKTCIRPHKQVKVKERKKKGHQGRRGNLKCRKEEIEEKKEGKIKWYHASKSSPQRAKTQEQHSTVAT